MRGDENEDSRNPTLSDVFNVSFKVIVVVLTIFIIAVLVAGLFQTIWQIKDFFLTKSIGQSLNLIVIDILSFLVIIELFKGFVVYFETNRFRLDTMIDGHRLCDL